MDKKNFKSDKSDKMNQRMKFTLGRVLDGLRSSVSAPTKGIELDIEETLKSEHFGVQKMVRHGFPYQPTAMAYDPVQNLLAIGTKSGSLRIFGRPGVDCHIKHDIDVAVLQILFLVNEGALVSVCADDQLHLWTLRQKRPKIVHSLKFQRERITQCQLPFQSKWLYIGTERGNVHVVNIESFQLSGYIINWNKAIELTRKTHPGPVVHLSDNPVDPNKLLIGFESGAIVLWDLKTKAAEQRFNSPESCGALRSVSWHNEGKQLMCSHEDGSLTIWSFRLPQKPQSIRMPHAKISKDGKPEACTGITKVEWQNTRTSEPYIIFSGGMPYEKAGRSPSLTVMHSKSTTVLEMEHPVVDFISLCSTPWKNDFQDPFGIVVLLQNDLVVVDLTSPGYPCFENPYPMDIHESPVTACLYFADCPTDLIPAFYSVGSKQKKTGFSDKEWPVNGGQWGQTTCSYPEIMITGHADGSLKFWDASAVTLQVLYKLKTAKLFEKSKCRGLDPDDDPFAVQKVHLCTESRLLCVVGFTHVILFRFSKNENTLECPSLEISIVYEINDEFDSPEPEFPAIPPKPLIGSMPKPSGSLGSYSSNASDGKENPPSMKIKSGARKWSAGYQPDLACVLCWIDEAPPPITSISVNSKYGLMAFGNECGIAIIDIVQKACIFNMGTPDLYGSMDPYARAPRSPKLKTVKTQGVDSLAQPYPMNDDCKSPTNDPSLHLSPPRTPAHHDCSPNHSPHHSPHLNKRPPGLGRSLESITEADSAATHPVKSHDSGVEVATEVVDNFTFDEDDVDDSHISVTNTGDIFFAKESTSYSRQESHESSKSEPAAEQEIVYTKKTLAKSLSTPSAPPRSRKRSVLAQPNLTDLDLASRNQVKEQPTSKPEASIVKCDEGKCEEEPAPRQRRHSFIKNTLSALNLRRKGDKEKANETESLSDKKEQQDIVVDFSQTWNSPMFSQQQDNIQKSQISDEGLEERTLHHRSSRSESDLTISQACFNNNTKLLHDVHTSDGVDDVDGDLTDHTYDPPKTAPPVVRREGLNFVRKVSKKIRRLSNVRKPDDFETEDKPRKSPRCFEVLDLSSDELLANNHHPPTYKTTYIGYVADKTDGSFSRSRSSSISSMENVSKEAIQALSFADTYCKKGETFTYPSLWVGTSLGTVLVISLTLQAEEARKTEPVIISPSGTIFRLKGAIMNMSFLDCNGILIPAVADQWQEGGRDITRDQRKVCRQQSVSNMRSRMSPTSSTDQLPCDRQFAIICSEKQARVMSLPSQTCAYKVKITETSQVVVADVVLIRDSVCMACYMANGHIMTFSLPSLKPLMDVDYLPLTNIRSAIIVAKTICFSKQGHALFFCTPTEVQKITVSAETCESLGEMLGELFLPTDTPEQPKQSFFKNLFTGGPATLDREELFGESSGKASKSVAKYSAGTAGMTQAQERSGLATSEIGRAKMAAIERGQKLGDLDEATERMRAEAEDYSKNARDIMLKYKNKRWYQF